MKVFEVIDRIEFNISTKDDLSGKSANNLFNKRNIVRALKTALDDYAQYTIGIEGIKSYSLRQGTREFPAPSDVVRSKAYRGMYVIINQNIYPLAPKDFNFIKSTFYTSSFTGIPSAVFLWENQINIYPLLSTGSTITTLSAPVTSADINIDVTSSNGLVLNQGRVKINDEIVAYDSITGNTLVGCTRGMENTTAVAHLALDAVEERNFFVYYNKLNFEIPCLDANTIDPTYLDKEMEVNDVHLEPIICEASYKLLAKIDNSRAEHYKRDYTVWLKRARHEIQRGRNDTNINANIRQPYGFEVNFQPNY